MSVSSRSITSILFDWDGTLMDSSRMGFVAFTRMFADMGLHFDRDVYENLYSPNWYSMYEALGLPADRWQQADDLWIRHYGEEPPSLVEGARHTLEELCRRGYSLGIVSSGSEARVRREISLLGLAPVFRVVVCNEDTIQKKPHPEGLHKAMGTMKVGPDTCAYVGDSPEDIEMGRRARMFTIGVRSAYPGSKRLLSAQPDIYVETIVEVLNHI